jgi:hypothetical protein
LAQDLRIFTKDLSIFCPKNTKNGWKEDDRRFRIAAPPQFLSQGSSPSSSSQPDPGGLQVSSKCQQTLLLLPSLHLLLVAALFVVIILSQLRRGQLEPQLVNLLLPVMIVLSNKVTGTQTRLKMKLLLPMNGLA